MAARLRLWTNRLLRHSEAAELFKRGALGRNLTTQVSTDKSPVSAEKTLAFTSVSVCGINLAYNISNGAACGDVVESPASPLSQQEVVSLSHRQNLTPAVPGIDSRAEGTRMAIGPVVDSLVLAVPAKPASDSPEAGTQAEGLRYGDQPFNGSLGPDGDAVIALMTELFPDDAITNAQACKPRRRRALGPLSRVSL